MIDISILASLFLVLRMDITTNSGLAQVIDKKSLPGDLENTDGITLSARFKKQYDNFNISWKQLC